MKLEALLRRLVPGVDKTWRGAARADIDAIEEHADRELPDVYRWFLETMGESMGALAYPSLDFSARRMLAAYRSDGIAFAEMLAWHSLVSHRVFHAPRRTHGLLLAESQLDVDALRPALHAIGFVEPIETGKACGIFEREDAALACWLWFHDFPGNLLTFELGTLDEASARKVLGELDLRAGVRVEPWPNDRP